MKLIFEYAGVAVIIIGLVYMRQIWNLCLHLLGALKERDELNEMYRKNEAGNSVEMEDLKHR